MNPEKETALAGDPAYTEDHGTPQPAPKKSEQTDAEILKEARDRCDEDESENSYIFTEIEDGQRFFLGGKQWDSKQEINRLQNEGGPRPCLTYDKSSTYINRLCNDQRMNRPGLNLKPKNDGADPKDTEIGEGLVRDITNNADSSTAHDTAMDMAANCGIGYFQVKTRYCDDDSFDQDIYLERIVDSRSVIFPFHQSKKIDLSDCNHAFLVDDIDKEEYKRDNPNFADNSGLADWTTTLSPPWVREKMLRRAYYFRKVFTRTHLCLLEDGTKCFQEDKPEGAKIINKRPVKKTTVEWFLMVAHQILDRGIVPGEYIPIVPCVGKETFYDGKRHFEGVAYRARDAQKMLNYAKSGFAEYVALAPKGQWMIAEGQDEGYSHEYKMANQANIIAIHYKPTTFEGILTPPPQRIQPQQLNMALVEEMRVADADLKEIIGLPDVNMGKSKGEKSGKAIMANQREGELINFHFADNLRKALIYSWKIIASMIPVVYDTPRTIQILGKTMEEQFVKINQEYTDDNGEKRTHDLTKLKYAVVADSGPNYSTKREKTAELLMQMIEHLPELGPNMIDLLAESIGASEVVVDRCKMLLPPQLQDNPNMKDIPAGVRALLQKLEQGLQQAHVVAQQKDQIISQLTAAVNDKSAEREVKIKTALIRAQAELHKANIEAQKEERHLHINHAHEIASKEHSHVLENMAVPAQSTGDESTVAAQ
jgi:hypothetical protein